MQYRLRTLLILLAVLPPLLAGGWWEYQAHKAAQARERFQPFIDPAWFSPDFQHFVPPVVDEPEPGNGAEKGVRAEKGAEKEERRKGSGFIK